MPQIAGARIALYGHDTYGLGHLRRNMAIAERLSADCAGASILALTGSPFVHLFGFPRNVDYIKVPAVTKAKDGSYVPRNLRLPLGDVTQLRSRVILAALSGFRPHVFLVDHAPEGMRGELLPALRDLRRQGARVLLGLRDIVDEPEKVRVAWRRDGIYDILDWAYDEILVYGDEDFFSPVDDYALPPGVADKVRFVGYIARAEPLEPAALVRARHGLGDGPVVVVTAGGGGDGYELLRRCAAAGQQRPKSREFRLLLVSGPLMSPRKFERLRLAVGNDPYVTLVRFVPDLPAVIAAADAVVAMAGYNSVTEILASRRPALLVPRVYPRKEQLLRAERLARRGLVRMVHPEHASPKRLLEEIEILLARSGTRSGAESRSRSHRRAASAVPEDSRTTGSLRQRGLDAVSDAVWHWTRRSTPARRVA